MIYFDTAYIAKCYLNERGSAEVRRLAAAHTRVACCEFGRLELAAAIHRNLREGLITLAQCQVIRAQIDADEDARIWAWLPVTPEVLTAAVVRFNMLKPSHYIRAGDALHLTCAQKHGFKEVHTSDRHMLDVAKAMGIDAVNVIP